MPNKFRLMLIAALVALSPWRAEAAELTVSAAASLTNAFKELAARFEEKNPQTKIMLNFGASGALLQQMANGAPVDVFASADQETMDQAEEKKLVKAADRRDFTRNSLVLIAPADGGKEIKTLEDLLRPKVERVAIGNPASVPVGRYTRHALQAAGLWQGVEPKMISAQNVRQALDYVARGEVDAGFVYATDAALVKDKVKILSEVQLDKPITYPLAVTAGSANREAALRFAAFIVSPEGQAVLASYGFSGMRP